MSEGDQFVVINGKSLHIMTYLKDFLFSPEQALAKVKTLSGGERNRLLLAKLFTQPANLLVLDEPTNDLDLETLELLESLLVEYQGTLILVSHDRSFLNNVVTSTIAFAGNGLVEEYVGGYDDWLRQQQATQPATQTGGLEKTASSQGKIDHQRAKEIRSLEQKIEKAEAKKCAMEEKLSDHTLYETGKEHLLADLQQQLHELKEELEVLMARWEQLLE